jgi:hypothetical protein
VAGFLGVLQMTEFDTTAEDLGAQHDESHPRKKTMDERAKGVLKKLILFISFGPGVLGLLWLIGKILRR